MTKHDRMLQILGGYMLAASGKDRQNLVKLHDAMDRPDLATQVNGYSPAGAAEMAESAIQWWEGKDKPDWAAGIQGLESPSERTNRISTAKQREQQEQQRQQDLHKSTGDAAATTGPKDATSAKSPLTRTSGGK